MANSQRSRFEAGGKVQVTRSYATGCQFAQRSWQARAVFGQGSVLRKRLIGDFPETTIRGWTF